MKMKFKEWFYQNEDRIISNLFSYLSIDTSSPHEHRALNFIRDYLNEVGFIIEKQHLHKDLELHSAFVKTNQSVINSERFNIKAFKYSKNNSLKSVLFNIHIDVVPATVDFPHAFSPYIKNSYIYGRGACDTKSNLIMLIEAIRFLQENNIKINKEIAIDLVIEEEVSSNGTISSILHGVEADSIIVMEPTNLLVYRGHRGCITANITVKGKAVHMGSKEAGVNAIESAYNIVNRLKCLELELLEEAKNNQAFSIWDMPVQINIGKINGGEWAGSVPEYCELICNIGFLPNYSIEDIKEKITKVCRDTNDDWTNNNVCIKFEGLKNSAYLIEKNDPNVVSLMNSLNRNGIKQQESYGWCVSCDAHLYQRFTGIPTLIFGAGDLSDAHSAHEKIDIAELQKGILILADYLSKEE
ncbi:ArgE/DapE family deacylase [Bacillus subtilis]|uniref:M20 family metallopeptidase n=1 Tax=Bacillus TaxID=1386 RepID=UPI0001F5B6A9|nr:MULTISPECIES: ArgE/DapE family deacylase [Bacillus]MBU8842185.1 ArgE/DapE family deacylase [Alkalicoccobacillus gibsonii]HCJ7961480.1 ArgE/DapE family deacylase [Klebsiella pneumoniae]ADV93490.1 acetylornithine deacetylase [Bacillus subtilis BSn5]AKE24471.1 acetylornithine deacetylase [Bacillus sp. LM 4-2]AXP49219.1 ArgE/DapE family deacylase [Bacillus subtilis subsp. subtilis]